MAPRKSTKKSLGASKYDDMPIVKFQGGRGIVCPVCKGTGRGKKKVRAWSPHDGDYEYYESVPCSRCYGHGVIPLGRPDW
jgi:hypothetical protein